MSKEEVMKVWQEYWVRSRNGELLFDEMFQAIFSELLRNCGDIRGKKILHAGCGRGMISAGLAELRADVHLLDISTETLHLARRHFASKNLAASLAGGDILGPPFGGPTFDTVARKGQS
jgi:2-polyprenyl-3-methyl-5-hydroxy-6-metoxy-1,4-benzoquinol methylase